MNRLVDELLQVEADLVVTITAPLDRRRPNNNEDRIQVRNLVADAHAQVAAADSGGDLASSVLSHLDKAAATVDLGSGAHGVVLVATPEWGVAHMLPFPVRADVALARTPATRYLVQGLRRSPRYRLLVVSDRSTRLFEAVRDDLREVVTEGFPYTADVVPRDLRAVAGRFALAPGGDGKEQWRNFYRSVDQAMTAVGQDDVLPIVLVGVRRSTSMFMDVSNNASLVIGRIDGAQDRTSPPVLGELAWPILRDHLKERRRHAADELKDAFHSGFAAVGLEDVWGLARQGRGRLLVVEEDFRGHPSVEEGNRLVPAVDDSSGDGSNHVLDDPVDELIEHVVRAGGEVEFTASGDLADVGRIGLILR